MQSPAQAERAVQGHRQPLHQAAAGHAGGVPWWFAQRARFLPGGTSFALAWHSLYLCRGACEVVMVSPPLPAAGALPLALTPRRPSPRGTRTAPCGSPAPPPAPPAQAFHLPRCGPPPPPWPRTDRGRRLAARLSQEVLSCAAVLLSLAPPPEADDRGHATLTAACGAPAASSFPPSLPQSSQQTAASACT